MTISGLLYSRKLAALLCDAGEWNEEKHKRDDNGRFVSGGGSNSRKFEIKATKEQIENLQPIAIMQGAEKLSKDELKAIYKGLPDGQNKMDGCKVKFVNSSFGKIIGHGNKEINKIIPQLSDIFNSSIPLHDSNYVSQNQRADGSFHKEHNNFIGYHNYLGKINDLDTEYYVRFTIQETKSNANERNQFHDVFVSDIELYKNTASSRNLSDNNRATDKQSGVDEILAQILFEVNQKDTRDCASVNSIDSLFDMIKSRRK